MTISFTDREERSKRNQALTRSARNRAARQYSTTALHSDTAAHPSNPPGQELHDRAAQAVAMGLHNLDLHHDHDSDGGPADASVHLTLARSHLVEALDVIRDLRLLRSSGLATAIDRHARSGSRARLVVVDNHNLFRTGLVALLNSVPTFAVEAEGSTGAEAVALCRSHRPDVLILDVQVPGIEPQGALQEILSDSPDTKVIVLTMRDDGTLIRELITAGVSGFLHKSVEYPTLKMAIDSVLTRSGQLVLHVPQKSMLADISAESGPSASISSRELEVLCLLAEGMSNAEIGRRLFISVSTVKRHLTHVYRKLGAASRVDALRRADALGLLSVRRRPAA